MLRRVLIANAVFSGIFGLIFIFDAAPLAAFMGLEYSLGDNANAVLIGLGIALVLFAAELVVLTSRKELKLKEIYGVILLDVGWVVGSLVLLFGNVIELSNGGWWMTAILADIVAVFAGLQYYALRKSQAETPAIDSQLRVRGSEA